MDKHIHESNLIEGINDPAEDRQSMTAWKWFKDQRKLDATTIKKLHKMVVFNQKDLPEDAKGAWRSIQVYVGNHVPPPPREIKTEMSKWLKGYKNWTPQEAHVRFETIHPFQDGNGRVGRMVMWWHEKSLGQEPTLLLGHERWKYYKWFKGRGNALEQTDIFGALLAMRDDNMRNL